MAIRAILILGAIMLTCGSAGLLLVRLTSPMLRGVGYLGGSFAAGSLGSALLLGAGHLHPQLSVTIADLAILGAFVLLHVAVLDIAERESTLPVFGFILLGAQALLDTSLLLVSGSVRLRVIAAGLLIAVQAIPNVLCAFRAGATSCASSHNLRWRAPGACRCPKYHAQFGSRFRIFPRCTIVPMRSRPEHSPASSR